MRLKRLPVWTPPGSSAVPWTHLTTPVSFLSWEGQGGLTSGLPREQSQGQELSDKATGHAGGVGREAGYFPDKPSCQPCPRTSWGHLLSEPVPAPQLCSHWPGGGVDSLTPALAGHGTWTPMGEIGHKPGSAEAKGPAGPR